MFKHLVQFAASGRLAVNDCIALSDSAALIPEGATSRPGWDRMSVVERGYLGALARNRMWPKFYEHKPDDIKRDDWRQLYHELKTQVLPEPTLESSRLEPVHTVSVYSLMNLVGHRVARKLNLSRSTMESMIHAALRSRRPDFDRAVQTFNPHMTEQELDTVYSAVRLLVHEYRLAEALVQFSWAIDRNYHEQQDHDGDQTVGPSEWKQDRIYTLLRTDDYAGGTGLLSKLTQDIVKRKELDWTLDDVRKLIGKYLQNREFEPIIRQLQKMGAMDRIEDSPMAPLELFVIKLLYTLARKLKSDDPNAPYDSFSDVSKHPSPDDKWPTAEEPDPEKQAAPGQESGAKIPSRMPAGRRRRQRQVKSLQIVSMPPSMTR